MINKLTDSEGAITQSVGQRLDVYYFMALADAARVKIDQGADPDSIDPEVDPGMELWQVEQLGQSYRERLEIARNDWEQKHGSKMTDDEFEELKKSLISPINRQRSRRRGKTLFRFTRGEIGVAQVLEDVVEDSIDRDEARTGRDLSFWVGSIKQLEKELGKPGRFLEEKEHYSRLDLIEAIGKIVESKVLADTACKDNGLSDWVNDFLDLIRCIVDEVIDLIKLGTAVNRVLSGRTGATEARKKLRMFLTDEKVGYAPLPGLEGTVKDLRSPRRLKAVIRTNVAMARGWQQRQAELNDEFYPGWELFRAGEALKRRDWETRWKEAAEAVSYEGVSRKGAMIALIKSPIWTELSAFRQPWPPFDWGSHMRVRPVDFEVCVEHGLLRESDFGHTAAQEESLNAHTEVSADKWDARVKAELGTALKGLAEWDRGVLRMTDVNGTRPYTAGQLAELYMKELPKGIPHLQRDAVREWIRYSPMFRDEPINVTLKNTPKKGKKGHDPNKKEGTESGKLIEKVPLDVREDAARAFRRIIPTECEVLYRGMRKRSAQELEEFDDMLRSNGNVYGARPGSIAESWTSSERNAEDFAGTTDFRIIIRCHNCKRARDIRPLYKAVAPRQQNIGKPIHMEAEWIYTGEQRFRVVNRHKINQRGVLYYVYDVEEIVR